MLPRNGREPSPRSLAVDGPQERFPGRLDDHFTPRARPAPSALPPERLRHLAARLHDLGPRPLYEFLREIEAGADLHERLARYSGLWPLRRFIQAYNGDQLPPPKIVVGRRP
jgi:hypothetical protein